MRGKGAFGRRGNGGGKERSGQRGAVIKAAYIKSGSTGSIKTSARYYGTRKNEQGESQDRVAFSRESDWLARNEVNDALDKADEEHKYHYRMAISPSGESGPDAEGVNLHDYTRDVMAEVERQQGGQASWVAFAHANESAHTERAHVHVIVSVNEKLDSDDLKRLREHATETWERNVEIQRELNYDSGLEQSREELIRTRAESRERHASLPPERSDMPAQGSEAERPERERGETQAQVKRPAEERPEGAAEHRRDLIARIERDQKQPRDEGHNRPRTISR